MALFLRLLSPMFSRMAIVVFVVLSTLDRNSKLITLEQKEESVLYNPIADFAPMLFPIIEGGDLRDSFDKLRARKKQGAESEEPGVIVQAVIPIPSPRERNL